MANSKLPHERLREWADDGERNETFPSVLMDKELVGGFVEGSELYDVIAFRKLADDIERFYIPRPRYGDGEPVQFGDEVKGYCGHLFKVGLIALDDAGIKIMQGFDAAEDEHILCVAPEKLVKRPAPKVLDADGVPIEIGDTVWHVDSGEELTVDEFANRGLGLVKCSDEDLACEDFDACKLTHREPDSLRKMRDDIAAYSADMAEPGSILEDALDGWADRLTALIEMGAE